MPIYEYTCDCGVFEAIAGYNDSSVTCPSCGQTASRIAVYKEQNVITNPSIPPRPQTEAERQEVNELARKELLKKNWSADRTIDEFRKRRVVDETGSLRVDTRGMDKTA